MQVTATPDELIVRAETAHTHDEREGSVCFREFSGKMVFRRFEMASPINVVGVTASLDKGILQVTAPKSTESKQVSAAVHS